ncbi:MAG: DNA replication/repair protein RecF [Polyangiaceae bacterium]
MRTDTRSLSLASIDVRGFRNLASVRLELGAGFNVFSGDNGQGKTNVLEAVYVLATSKSFRAAKPGDLVRHGGDVASVRGVFVEQGEERNQSVGLRPGARMAKIEDKKPKTLAAYAVRTPIVVFHPQVMSLSMAGGSERRRLLDRISLYRSPASLEALENYDRASKARQKALETRGVAARDLDEWEALVVEHGTRVLASRREATELVARAATLAYERIGAPGRALGVSYVAGAPESPDAYREALVARRPADLRRGSATVGPHRDDVELRIGDVPVRGVASQGQHRAVVLALKLAEIEVVRSARGVQPVLLLDDVSSELDRERTSALFAFLRDHEGQVLLTTTRPELIDTGDRSLGPARRNFAVERGEVRDLRG